jgi:UDP-N-acetylmuramate dehydrogenase
MSRRAAGVETAGLNRAHLEPAGAPRRTGPRPASGTQAAWLADAAALARAAGVRLRAHEPMAGHTTMRVGGPADLLAIAGDVGTLAALVRGGRAAGIPVTVLGRGSDLVVSDTGIRGLVVLSRAEGWHIDSNRLIAEAGLPLARAATLTQQAGLSGLEFGLAVPGTVGGAIWANAGAHGSDVASVLESVTVLREDGVETAEPAEALGLGYRESRFKHSANELILTATFGLAPADPATIKGRLDEIRRWRREHQPLGEPSAGSVFRNPPGDSAGRLIDACGLRGARLGGASISEKHANFLVNDGGATASEIRTLAERARKTVAQKFGVELVYEVQFAGDWSGWRET